MPKLIDHAFENILAAAKDELILHPDNFSMRQVAKKANVAVGTIYHYFPDKINLIASVLLSDWKNRFDSILIEMNQCQSLEDVLLKINRLIFDYRVENNYVFQSYKKEETNKDLSKLHKMFVSEIKHLFQKGKSVLSLRIDEEKDLMISEMILIQAKSDEIKFDTLVEIVNKII